MLNSFLFSPLRSANVAPRGRSAVDRRPGARPQPPPGGHGAVPNEREGALPHDDGHVLPEGTARRQDALQGLQHQAVHGHVQLQRRGGLLAWVSQDYWRTEDSISDMNVLQPVWRKQPKNKVTQWHPRRPHWRSTLPRSAKVIAMHNFWIQMLLVVHARKL